MTLRELLARRDVLRTDLRALIEKNPEGLPEAEQQRADDLQAEADKLNDLERRIVALDDLDRRANGRPLDGGDTTPGRPEVRVGEHRVRTPESFDGAVMRAQDGTAVPVLEARHRFSSFVPAPDSSAAAQIGLGAFLRAMRNGPQSDLERRALSEASIGAGGAFLPTPLSLEVIDLLRARTVAFQAGARTIPMSTATLRFARQTADAIGAWRAEASAIHEDTPVFDTVSLSAKSWALLVRVSRELLEDAQNLDVQLRTAFAAGAAIALDRAILSGAGSAIEPQGIIGTAGIQTIASAANGTVLAGWSRFLDATGALEAANAGTVTAAVMSPRTGRVLDGLVDTLGQPLEPPPRIAGVPLLRTTSMSNTETQGTSNIASSILLGDWSTVYVGMRTELQITTLQERYADTGQVGFILWMRGDVALARPASMARIAGIIP